ncbi:hypothetical protein AVEN_236441-1 [Araneus ventricosus]|uniref:CCHC-type domain-containing protein n=1 Tax=Araneus ventricosus TaxID=182803 RepID=A0A4Y2ITM3_ARAVE|nr:hypothetical protein AVEN_236441-1 [Araneus ventricosus]
MGKKKSGPFSGQHIVSNSSIANNFPTYFLIKRNSTNNETFHSVSPFLVEKAITSHIGEVKSTKKLRSGDLLVEILSRKQSEQIMKIKAFSDISVTVSPHESLNSSKGVISCGELLNVPLESILKDLQSQGVSHVRRISIRRDGQLLNTKHLILTFSSAKLPEHIKAGYMRLSVRPYIPNPLRCFQCQRFGHSKTSCRGTLTCARCAEVGHDSSQCTAAEKCVNCKEAHTSFSRNCSAWKLEKEIVATKIKKQISYPEARKLVKSQTAASATSYSSIVKNPCTTACTRNNLGDLICGNNKSDSTNLTPRKKTYETTSIYILSSVPFKASYTPSEICPRSIDPVLKLSSTVTRNETVSFQIKVPEINETPPDFSDFKTVTNRKKLKKDNQDNITDKVSQHYKPPQLTDKEPSEASNAVKQGNIMVTKNGAKSAHVCSVGPVPDPMVAFPPEKTTVLQSLESDADAEMSSSSASEGDTLEYNMSEDLEDTPQNICPTTLPPPSTARKR